MGPWLVTVAVDLCMGGMAWRLAKALEASLKVQTQLLGQLTQRVERIEERVGV